MSTCSHATIRTRALLAAAIACCALASAACASDVAKSLRALSGGARVKVVWQRLVGPHPSKGIMKLKGDNSSLVVLDTDEAATRVLVPGQTSCYSPLITADGDHVVYYNVSQKKSYCVSWDGSERRPLGSEQIDGVWADPRTGTSYIFYGSPLMRSPLENPSKAERVFERGGRVTFSADGTRAGGLSTHPMCGVVNLVTGAYKSYSRGCWGMIAPDSSYRYFHLDGPHKALYMYDDGGANRRKIAANTMPGVNGRYDVYAPRWSNHPRFITTAGPIGITSGSTKIKPTQTDVYIGMFDEQYTRIAAWVNLSPGDTFETHAHAWFETPEARRAADARRTSRGGDTRETAAAAQEDTPANEDARRSLAAADAALERKEFARAFELYTLVTQRYPGTVEAVAAGEKLAHLRADASAMATVRTERAAQQCRGMLSMARSYARNGMKKEARGLLQKVIDEYPETSFAKEARRELRSLK